MNNQTENPKEEQTVNPKKEQTLKPKKVWIEPELKLISVYSVSILWTAETKSSAPSS